MAAEHERALVERSFGRLGADSEVFVGRFYDRLFERHPELRPMFRSERDVQTRKMAVALTSIVVNLHAPLQMEDYLVELMARHYEMGVRDEHFAPFAAVLLEVLGETFGEEWTPEVASAWRAALDDIVATMKRAARRSRTETGSKGAPSKPLTPHEVHLVTNSFARLAADDGFLERFYAMLWGRFPYLKALFESAMHSDRRALAVTIAGVVAELGGEVPKNGLLDKLARRQTALGMRPADYPAFTALIIEAIARAIDVAEGDDVMRAWRKALTRIATIMQSDGRVTMDGE